MRLAVMGAVALRCIAASSDLASLSQEKTYLYCAERAQKASTVKYAKLLAGLKRISRCVYCPWMQQARSVDTCPDTPTVAEAVDCFATAEERSSYAASGPTVLYESTFLLQPIAGFTYM